MEKPAVALRTAPCHNRTTTPRFPNGRSASVDCPLGDFTPQDVRVCEIWEASLIRIKSIVDGAFGSIARMHGKGHDSVTDLCAKAREDENGKARCLEAKLGLRLPDKNEEELLWYVSRR